MSRRWILIALGAVIVLGGGGFAFAKLFGSITGAVREMPRAMFPGEKTLDLPAGPHKIYYEAETIIDGKHFASSSGHIRCQVVGPDGAPLELTTPSMNETYQASGYRGNALFVFEVTTAGTHKLTCVFPDRDDAQAVLAVGRGVLRRSMFTTGAIGLGSFVVGIAVILVGVFTGRKRRPGR